MSRYDLISDTGAELGPLAVAKLLDLRFEGLVNPPRCLSQFTPERRLAAEPWRILAFRLRS